MILNRDPCEVKQVRKKSKRERKVCHAFNAKVKTIFFKFHFHFNISYMPFSSLLFFTLSYFVLFFFSFLRSCFPLTLQRMRPLRILVRVSSVIIFMPCAKKVSGVNLKKIKKEERLADCMNTGYLSSFEVN